MPVHINGCFSLPHPVSNFSWTIRCESGYRNVQWGIEWQGSKHGKNCVCVWMCVWVQSHVNGMAPLREQDITGEDTVEKQLFLVAIRSMLPCLAPGAVLGADTQESVLGCGGTEEGYLPTAEPPISSAWSGREVRNTSRIWLYQAGSIFPPQDKGLYLCNITWK